MMKIRKSEAPRLREAQRWSKCFHDFLSKCLNKNPDERATARELLAHPFVSSSGFMSDDRCPIKHLLGEKNATVNVVEEIELPHDDTASTNNTCNQTSTNSSASVFTSVSDHQ
jgi:serine/threonine protein kinase